MLTINCYTKEHMNNQNKQNLFALRHSAEHILTQAMHELYGADKVIMAMGPATDTGFYFDFDSNNDFKLTENMFPEIESKMIEIVKRALPITKKSISQAEARKLFANNPYKIEWLDKIKNKNEEITIYRTGDQFIDLCAGPHVDNTKEVRIFKLLSIAGAYWHGDEKNKMLTRIYGTAFKTPKELKQFLWAQEEAKKRDHRKLGRELDLYVIHDDIGKGLPLLTPKGTIIRNEIIKYERKLEKQAGFQEVWTPHIAKNDLYKRTGHWEHYRDVMYAPFGIDDETYVLKPMNCPHHYMIYSSKIRSYKDLPFRLCEPGTCYRYEKTGELGGLTRVRALTIDDAHILMTEDQIDQEFETCIKMVKDIFHAFGLTDYRVRLSLNDPSDNIKYIDDDGTWKRAGEKLKEIIKNSNLDYEIGTGEASFYGPKLDFMVKDALGRDWQMSTLQLDLFMSKRLNLVYTDKEGKKQHPVILHRGLTGSLERTMGLLIEHYAGAFPLWLSPLQLQLVTISEKEVEYADSVLTQLKQAGLRVELDDSNKSLGKKLALARGNKTPYLGIIGAKEVETKTITLKKRPTRHGEEGEQLTLNLNEVIAKLKQEIDAKS
ncbi:MAG: threonine--tRNA ligase [Candidatus Latescibacterota bacterium]|nr:MAG: threonine--tRNA ligase [Candidatus Latescibacterota bacterium]